MFRTSLPGHVLGPTAASSRCGRVLPTSALTMLGAAQHCYLFHRWPQFLHERAGYDAPGMKTAWACTSA